MKRAAIYNLQISIDADLEGPFLEYLNNLQFDVTNEIQFLDTHRLSVRQFVEITNTFKKMIIELEAAQEKSTEIIH